MKKYALLYLFIIPFLFGCKTIKTVKLFQKGEITEKEFITRVPFEFRLGLIVIQVEIQGQQYDFIVDSGAPNVISSDLAQKLNISSDIQQKTKDSQGGSADLGFTTIPEIVIGGIHFKNTGTAIADLQQSTEIGCLRIDGFIGANLMKEAIWHFDYQQKIITITHSKSNLEIPAEAKTIPFKQQITGTPLIDISYNGIVDKKVTFDLGSNGYLVSSTQVLKEINSKKAIPTNYGFGNNSSGLFGNVVNDTMLFGVVSQVNFGGIELKEQLVTFNDQKAKNIGTGIFKNYHVILDWGKSEITMIPTQKTASSELNSTGVSMRFLEGKLYISFIYHGSDAEKQGVALGDQVLELNGKNFRNCTSEQWCKLINDGIFPAENEENTLILSKNGEEKTFSLKKTNLIFPNASN